MSAHLRGIKPAVKADPEALATVPVAPRHLDAYARAEWKRVMPQLVQRRVLTAGDLGNVENYCVMQGIVRQLEQERKERGGMIDLKAFGVQNRAAQTARQLASEYGLSPVSRSRLGAVEADDEDDDNPLNVK